MGQSVDELLGIGRKRRGSGKRNTADLGRSREMKRKQVRQYTKVIPGNSRGFPQFSK